MNPNRATWLMITAMLTLLVAFSAPAFPKPQETRPDSGDPTTTDESAVEKILKQQEELLEGRQFSYDPEDRRDPFQSLYEKVALKADGPRPRGVAGMLVAEIDLTGIVEDATGGDLAYFTGSDDKGYFLRIGERVYDGRVIAIDARRGAVTFRQQVDDPDNIKPYRDVVRRLVPMHEESTYE